MADLRISSDARPEQLVGLDPTRQRLLETLPPPARDDAPGPPEIALRFGLTPVAVRGTRAVESVTFRAVDGTEHVLRCGLLVRAVGFRGRALPGVPFDDDRGVVPNTGAAWPRASTWPAGPSAGRPASWDTTGPAAETVERLLEDHAAGLLEGRRA